MKIEPTSKAESRVLKRVRVSEHWTARLFTPIPICMVPLVFLAGGFFFWRLGHGLAGKVVMCVNTGEELVPCPEIPSFTYLPGEFFFLIGLFFLFQAWSILFVMRERRIMNRILNRIETENSEQHPARYALPRKREDHVL